MRPPWWVLSYCLGFLEIFIRNMFELLVILWFIIFSFLQKMARQRKFLSYIFCQIQLEMTIFCYISNSITWISPILVIFEKLSVLASLLIEFLILSTLSEFIDYAIYKLFYDLRISLFDIHFMNVFAGRKPYTNILNWINHNLNKIDSLKKRRLWYRKQTFENYI